VSERERECVSVTIVYNNPPTRPLDRQPRNEGPAPATGTQQLLTFSLLTYISTLSSALSSSCPFSLSPSPRPPVSNSLQAVARLSLPLPCDLPSLCPPLFLLPVCLLFILRSLAMSEKPNAIIFGQCSTANLPPLRHCLVPLIVSLVGGVNTCSRPLASLLLPLQGEPLVSVSVRY
jgi:hypothetical protein